MSTWRSRLLALGAVLFLGGWGLVLASGHGGNSTGGSELVWQVGGLMVYASIPTLLIVAGWGLAARVRNGAHSRSR
jgi:hypothetical protein